MFRALLCAKTPSAGLGALDTARGDGKDFLFSFSVFVSHIIYYSIQKVTFTHKIIGKFRLSL